MAFAEAGLGVVAEAQGVFGFTWWSYATTDPLGRVLEPGYFNSQSRRMQAGDLVLVGVRPGPGGADAIRRALLMVSRAVRNGAVACGWCRTMAGRRTRARRSGAAAQAARRRKETGTRGCPRARAGPDRPPAPAAKVPEQGDGSRIRHCERWSAVALAWFLGRLCRARLQAFDPKSAAHREGFKKMRWWLPSHSSLYI